MKRIRRAFIVVTLACASVFSATAPAFAAGASWGEITAYDGSVPLAAAKGDFANNGGVYATVGANWRDIANDGHKSYVEVVFYQFYRSPTAEYPEEWHQTGKVQSERYDGKSWKGTPLSSRLNSLANKARAVIKVCVDIPNKGDKCSAGATMTFNF